VRAIGLRQTPQDAAKPDRVDVGGESLIGAMDGAGLIPDSSGCAEQPSVRAWHAGHEWNLPVRPLILRSHRHFGHLSRLAFSCQAPSRCQALLGIFFGVPGIGIRPAGSSPSLTPLLGKDSPRLGAPCPCQGESAGLAPVLGLLRPAACRNTPWRRAVRNESARPDEPEWIWDYPIP
jgi:hypothetical protein